MTFTDWLILIIGIPFLIWFIWSIISKPSDRDSGPFDGFQ